MYKIEEKFSKGLYEYDTKQKLKITIDGIEIDSKYVKEVSYDDECFDSENFTLGNACIGQITLLIDKEAVKDFKSFNEFYFENIITLSDGSIGLVPIGYFYAHEEDTDKSNDYLIKFVLKDKIYDMSKDNIDFSEQVKKGNFTRQDLVKLICQKYDLNLATPNFLNNEKLIGVYDETLKVRDWLIFISERAGGFCKILRGKSLYIKALNETDKVEIPNNKLGTYKNDELKKITGVYYQNGVQDYRFGNNDGVVVYLSQDNYFSCEENEVEKIYNSLNGLQFQSLDATIWGDCSIDTGDIININGLISFCQKHWKFGNGWNGNYQTTLKIVTGSSSIVKISSNQRQRKIQSKINEVEATLDIVANETTENSQKMVQFGLNLDEIEQQVAYFDDQSQSIAKLTTSIEGIEAQIGSITGTTVNGNGIGNVTLKDVLTSELLYLQIYPTKEDLSYLNISPKTGLGNNTKLTSRDLLFLKDPKNVFNGKLENGSIDKDGQNGTSSELDTTTYIELKEKLYSINDVADEYDLISGKGIKRIGEYIFTGDENWVISNYPYDGTTQFTTPKPKNAKTMTYPICTHFIESKTGKNSVYIGNSLNFYPSFETGLTTIDLWINFLKQQYNSGTPVKIQYELEKPEEFTTEPVNVQLRKGYNKIEINDKNGLLNKTKLSYLADTEKTIEGTNQIIIDDAEPVNARSLIVYGNSFQEIYNSKNILNMPEKNYSYNDSSITMHQSEIVINGNEAGNSAFAYNSDKQKINLELGSNYTYSVYQDDNNKWDSGSFVFKLRLHFDDGTYEDIVLAQITSPGAKKVYKSFTPSQDVVAIHFIGNTYAIKGLNTPATFKLQVEPGEESTDYEPYGAMPSPEFPSEIKCVEGLENIFDGELEYGSLNNTNGEPSETNNCIRSKNFISVKSNKEYTILNDKNYSQYIYEYNENKEFIKFTNNTENPFIFTTGNSTKYIKFRTVATNTENDLNTKFMLSTEKDIDFNFYDKKFLKLLDTGKNLFNFQNTVSVSSSSVADENGWITSHIDNSSGSSTRYSNYFTHNLNVVSGKKYIAVLEVKNVEGTGDIDVTGNGQFNEVINYNFSDLENNKTYVKTITPKETYNRDEGLRSYVGFRAGSNGTITYRLSVLEDTSITPENFVYEPYVPNKVRNTEKFAIEKSTYTIDLTGATDTYLFFYDENDNFISKSGYHKLPYTFSNTNAKYIRFMFKNVNNDNLNADDIKNLTIYDVNANEPTIRYTLPCNLYYINDEIKDELIIDYEKEQTFVIKRVGINAETGEKYALETARTDFYKYVGIDFKEDGNYLIKMESFTTAYINARALANSIYTAQYPTRVEVYNAIKLSEEGIRQEVNGKVTDLNGNVKELKGSLELKLNTKDLCTELNGSADKIAFIGDRFSWKSTYSSMTDTGTLKATNVDLTGKITATSGTIGGCSISSGVLKVADANITSINASKITAGTMSADRISGGTIDATKTTVKNLNATNITSGTIDASKITVKNLNASNITSGTISTSRLESKVITTSNLSAQKISASQITTGTLSANRISGGTISGNNVSITNINASNLTSGTISSADVNIYNGTGFLKMLHGSSYHPFVSALNVARGSGGISFRNSGDRNSTGSQIGQIYADNNVIYISASNGTNIANYLKCGSIGISGVQIDGASDTYIRLNYSVVLKPNPSGGAYIWGTEDYNKILTSSGSPSTLSIKENVKLKDTSDIPKMLEKINLYDYKYISEVENGKEDYGYIIDYLEKIDGIDKYFKFNNIDRNNIKYKTINHEHLSKFLLGAVIELQKQINNLKERILE